MALRSVDLLIKNILEDPTLLVALQADPKKVLLREAEVAKQGTPLESDPVIYRIVVSALGAVLLVVAIGLIVLAFRGVPAFPDGLVAIGSAAGGALAGLLAPTPMTRS